MRTIFHPELDALGANLTAMSALVGRLCETATTAVLEGDLQASDAVTTAAIELVRMRAGTEMTAVTLLARQSPVASDLRRVTSALWIIGDLHRMGVRIGITRPGLAGLTRLIRVGYLCLMVGQVLVVERDGDGWRLAGPAAASFGLVNEFLGYLADRNYSPRTRRSSPSWPADCRSFPANYAVGSLPSSTPAVSGPTTRPTRP